MSHPPFPFRTVSLVLALSAAAALPAWASKDHGSHGTHGKPAAQADAGEMTDGEVRRVDKEAGKLTLRHAEIKSLDMPPMTMVFRVKSPALLEGLKEGDKILFTAEKIDGAYTVTSVEKRP